MCCKGHLQEAATTGHHNLPTLNCECGFKILLIPDVTAMKRAIRKHATNCPRQKRYNQLGLGRLSETELTMQLLTVISDETFQDKHKEGFNLGGRNR
jgi:predicted nucleic acid-binding protein